jgi:hypothetical protein
VPIVEKEVGGVYQDRTLRRFCGHGKAPQHRLRERLRHGEFLVYVIARRAKAHVPLDEQDFGATALKANNPSL